MSLADRTPLLKPAVTAAALAFCLIGTGFAVGAGAWTLMGFIQRGEPLAGLALSPFVAGGLAVICGLLGLLPAVLWIISACFVGPGLWLGRARALRGIVLGLGCSAPAFLIGHWISQHDPFRAGLPLGPVIDLAVIFAGILAGLIMIRLMRRETASPA